MPKNWLAIRLSSKCYRFLNILNPPCCRSSCLGPGDAAGYITPSLLAGNLLQLGSDGCAETIVEFANGQTKVSTEADLKLYLKRLRDKKYGLFKVLDILQSALHKITAGKPL